MGLALDHRKEILIKRNKKEFEDSEGPMKKERIET
jgi:hypothetical protein